MQSQILTHYDHIYGEHLNGLNFFPTYSLLLATVPCDWWCLVSFKHWTWISGLSLRLFSLAFMWIGWMQTKHRAMILSNKGVGREKQIGGFCIPVETSRSAIIIRALSSSSDTRRDGTWYSNCSIYQLVIGKWRQWMGMNMFKCTVSVHFV